MTTTLGASVSQLSAAALSAATRNDPQFRLPELPCVVPGAVVVWLDDELVIEGTGSRRVLSGRSARRLLPDLLPLLDGHRDLTRLVDDLPPGFGAAQVRAVLLLLYSCGLLQDGPLPADPTDQELLLSRLLDTTRVNTDVAQAERRLRSATVAVHAPAELARLLERELASVGLQVLSAGPGASAGPVSAGPASSAGPSSAGPSSAGPAASADRPTSGDTRPQLAVVWTGGDRTEVLRQVEVLRRQQIAVLPIGPTTGGLYLGPYSAPDHGPCPRCVLDQTAVDDEPAGQTAVDVLAALLAIECTALLGRVGSSAAVRGQVRLDRVSSRTSVHFLAPRPGCPLCGDPRSTGQDPPPAYVYEASVAFPARRLVNPRDHQHHFEAANIALQFEQAQYRSDAATVALPGADLTGLLPDRAGEVAMLDADGLGTVLAAAAGLKPAVPGPPGKPARWAPTGGNLASPTLFAVVRNVPGITSGVWAYQPAGHQLVAVGANVPTIWTDDAGAASLVFSGALFRVSKKYRTFAYRIVHLDAGVAMAHVALAAGRLGIPVRGEPAWPDTELRRALGLSFDTDTITGVLHLGSPR